jgi:integrase/recombinase XerD
MVPSVNIDDRPAAINGPKSDQDSWQAAIRPGLTVLSSSGAMAHLRARSSEIYARHANQARRWAEDNGCPADLTHAALWTDRHRLGAFVTYLRLRHKPNTSRLSLIALERVMKGVAPEVNCHFILAEVNALPRLTDRAAKRERMQDSRALWECGIALIELAGTPEHDLGLPDVTYRTGVQIAALSQWAYRLEVFTTIELWLDKEPPLDHPVSYLTRKFGRWFIIHPGTQSFKRNPISEAVPQALTELFEAYIAGPRQRLCGDYAGRALWVSAREGPLGANALYKQIVAKTEFVFGKSVNPHLFRDCLATSLARRYPERVPSAHYRLANSPVVTAKVYDHTGTGTLEGGLAIAEYMEQFCKDA